MTLCHDALHLLYKWELFSHVVLSFGTTWMLTAQLAISAHTHIEMMWMLLMVYFVAVTTTLK